MEQKIHELQENVWAFYAENGRHDLPWRKPEPDGSFDAYKILVSEVMLQQTQVARVIPKYTEFLRAYPTVRALAEAPLGEVLKAWQGLGYNRRAKFLWQAAGVVAKDFGGQVPRTETQLVKLPGIGKNTAAAIVAYAYDQKTIFVETNIRTVIIYHFFMNTSEVNDNEILGLVARFAPGESTREWYWALMDYGTYLKRTKGNLNKLSKGYAKQSPFHGSRRQIRGAILRLLGDGAQSADDLFAALPDERTPSVLEALVSEGLVRKTTNGYSL